MAATLTDRDELIETIIEGPFFTAAAPLYYT